MYESKSGHGNQAGHCLRQKLWSTISGGIAFSSLLLCGSPAVYAQTEMAGGMLEEVVVTVRRRAEMATDVPISITAMTPEMLENRGITELSKLDTNVAGLNITTGSAGSNTPLIALRGQRPSEVLLTHDPAVPLYFAEIALTPTYGTNLSMYDLASVQVLKGPQGTLFGRNSTGGAVLFTPKAPETSFGGYAKATVGNYDLYKFEGAVSLPVNDVLGFRLAAQKTDRDGYQSIVGDTPVACDDCVWDEDSYGLRLVTSIDTGNLSNLTTIAYDDSDNVAKSTVGRAFNPASSLGSLWNATYNGGGRDWVAGILSGIGLPDSTINAALSGAEFPEETLIDDYLARQSARGVHDIELSVIPYEKTENRFFANNTEYNLNDDLVIKNVFGYRYLEMTSISDVDGSPLPLFGSVQIDSASLPDDVSVPSDRRILTEQFSNEIQLIGSTDTLDWIVGAYWFKMEGSESFFSSNMSGDPDWSNLTGGLAGFATTPRYGSYRSSSESEVLNEAYAVFGEGTYTLTDEWSVTLGVRQTWDKRQLTTHQRSTDSDPTTPPDASDPAVCDVYGEDGNLLQDPSEPYSYSACSRTVDESFSSPTGRVALNYTPAYGELLYGSISTGYRTGGFQTRGNDNFTLQPYDEEKVITYEVGHKADWYTENAGTFRTAVAFYWQDYSDIQKTQGLNVDGDFVTATINAAEAVIRGVDLDITWVANESLLFTLNYAYIDAYYKEWERALDDGSLQDNKSSPFVYVPEHSLSATAQYTLPLAPELGDISLIANVYWQSSQDTQQEPQYLTSVAAEQGWSDATLQSAREFQQIDAYDIWNFRVNWKSVMGSDFDMAVYVDNAFDEEYTDGGISALPTLGWIAETYGPPRTFGASLQWNF